jgi:hypothetical protein
MMNHLFLLILIAFVTSGTCAFVPTTPGFTRDVARRMVRFDGERWIPETDDETPDAGYSIGGTLLRFGPIPAIKRVFQSDEYEQAVLKFMYSEGCDRNQAQGNMDYYMRNPNDWFAVRLKEEKSGVKKDFVSIDAVKTALTLVWGVLVLVIGAKLALQIASGELDLVSSKTFNPPFLFCTEANLNMPISIIFFLLVTVLYSVGEVASVGFPHRQRRSNVLAF